MSYRRYKFLVDNGRSGSHRDSSLLRWTEQVLAGHQGMFVGTFQQFVNAMRLRGDNSLSSAVHALKLSNKAFGTRWMIERRDARVSTKDKVLLRVWRPDSKVFRWFDGNCTVTVSAQSMSADDAVFLEAGWSGATVLGDALFDEFVPLFKAQPAAAPWRPTCTNCWQKMEPGWKDYWSCSDCDRVHKRGSGQYSTAW